MLADPKSEALTTNFADQWLHLQNLKEWSPDLFLFPEFRSNSGGFDAARDGAAVRQASCAKIATFWIC